MLDSFTNLLICEILLHFCLLISYDMAKLVYLLGKYTYFPPASLSHHSPILDECLQDQGYQRALECNMESRTVRSYDTYFKKLVVVVVVF